MRIRARHMLLQFLALLLAVSVAHAQPVDASSGYSQPELDQMLAPIALYPDGLLSQVLMAATYPTEVVEAAYWTKENPDYRGDAAVQAVEGMPWDISVKSLVPFPQILATMESRLDWTERLGNAFLVQQQQVMDTVQRLRHQAMQAGYLLSDSRIRVAVQDQLISIEPVSQTTVYVPYYNPTVVYGRWSEPAYAPVYWEPWPGYTSMNRGWIWAAGTVVGAGLLYGAFDWRSHRVRINRLDYYRGHSHDRYRTRDQWQHDPRHRREVPYRHPVAQQKFGRAAASFNAKEGVGRRTITDIRDGRKLPASPDARLQVRPQIRPPEARPQARPEVKPQVSPDARSKLRPQVRPQIRPPEARPQARPEVKPQVSPDARSKLRPQVSPDARSKLRPQVSPDARPQVRPQTSPPEARPQARPEARTQVRPEMRTQARPEAKPAARPEAKPAVAPARPVLLKDKHD